VQQDIATDILQHILNRCVSTFTKTFCYTSTFRWEGEQKIV